MTTLLETKALRAWYGAAQILYDVDLSVRRGEVVALMGRNGAGKSTTLKAIMGMLAKRAGSIRFLDHDISRTEPHHASRLGLDFVPEDRRVFTDLTVMENLEVGRQPARRWADGTDAPLYTIGCKGRKSHGYLATIKKRTGFMPAEKIKAFEPKRVASGEDTYNDVAELYDSVFTDIRVRKDEWDWLNEHLPESRDIRVLDIGCGNGALLNAVADRIGEGVGVDESGAILERARRRSSEAPPVYGRVTSAATWGALLRAPKRRTS